MGLAPAVHAHRHFLQNVQDDGNIVRRQVPGDIDVLLKKPQVQAARTDVSNVTDVTAIHDFFDLPDRRRIKECVTDHQNQPFFVGDLDQLFALFGRGRHRLFNESVLAGQQTGFRHRVMGSDRRRDNYGVESGAVEQMAVIFMTLDFRI